MYTIHLYTNVYIRTQKYAFIHVPKLNTLSQYCYYCTKCSQRVIFQADSRLQVEGNEERGLQKQEEEQGTDRTGFYRPFSQNMMTMNKIWRKYFSKFLIEF